MTFEEKVELVNQIMFNSDVDRFNRILWRMSNGSRSHALNTTQKFCLVYGGFVVSDEMFDRAMLQMNQGIEIEWAE